MLILEKSQHITRIGGKRFNRFHVTEGDIPVAIIEENGKISEVVNPRGRAYAARKRMKYRIKFKDRKMLSHINLESTPVPKKPIKFGPPPCWIIEGIDSVGKGTLINEINNRIEFHQVIKYDKPKKLECYSGSLRKYQEACYETGFNLLGRAINTASHFVPKLIFDRFHLGELVYSPMYRGFSGEFVFDMEKKFINDFGGPSSGLFSRRVCLVLLVVTDFANLPADDGLSHDPTKKELEQSMFIDAFNRSKIPNKVMISIDDENGIKTPEQIFKDLMLAHK